MNVIEKQQMIMEVLIKEGWTIEKVEYTGRCLITARKNFAEIGITTEECLCHGGRIWISDPHTNQYYEISHETHDESLGITDSDSELRWEIQNELQDYLNRYSKFVYKLVVINKYGRKNGADVEETSYFASMESVTRRLFDGSEPKEKITDYNMITERVEGYHQNPDIKEVIIPISKEERYSWECGRTWFKIQYTKRKDSKSEWIVDHEYEAYISVFRK